MKGSKFKKAAVILSVSFTVIVVIAMVVLIKAGVISVKTSAAVEKKQITVSGDNLQKGLVAVNGEYIYFPDPSDNNKIYKVKTDGSGKTKFIDDSAKTLVLADEWIFYSNASDGGKLYRINVDGTGRTKMTEGEVNYITVTPSAVYYSNSADSDRLYRIGLNGEGNTKLSDEGAAFINAAGNFILYKNDAQQIIKINSDGTGRTVFEKKKVSFLKTDSDGKAYYSMISDTHSLYSIDQNGGSSTKVLKTETYNADTHGQWIYFINNELENYYIDASYIYRVKKDGTELQRISEEKTDEFSVVGNRIFYRSIGDGGRIYAINLDGSQRKAIDGKTFANSVTEVCRALKDNVDFEIADKKTSEAYEKAKEVLAQIIKPDMSPLEKELAVHDYLVRNVKYDYEVAETTNLYIRLGSHDAYSALVKGKAVCDGFAWATKLMLSMCGIDSDVVIGNGKSDNKSKKVTDLLHAWNSVKIEGDFYLLDVTWDENIYEKSGLFNYTYFNVSDSVMSKDHEWDKTYAQQCTSTKYKYFHDIQSAYRDGAVIYYSNASDNYKLYKMNIDGSNKKKLNNHKSLFIAVSGGNVYYSDYEDGGVLCKMSTEGQNKTILNSDWSINIEVKDGYVEYVNHDDNKKYRIKI